MHKHTYIFICIVTCYIECFPSCSMFSDNLNLLYYFCSCAVSQSNLCLYFAKKKKIKYDHFSENKQCTICVISPGTGVVSEEANTHIKKRIDLHYF